MDDPRLRRIAFVTRHYAEFRGGVTRLALAPVLLATALLGLPTGPATAFIAAAGFTGVSTALDRWMDRRFGRVLSGTNHQRWVMLICLVTFFVTMRLDRSGFDAGRPSLVLLAAAGYGLWLCVRLWPHGTHNLLPAVVAAMESVLYASVDNREAFLAWERFAYSATLLAWTAAGLIDLALLFKALPYRPQEATSVDAS